MNRPIEFIPFSRPSIGKEEEQAVVDVLRSGWLTTGKVAEQFEKEFADYSGAKHALAVNSATSGLHLCLEALGVGPNTLVVTSPYTFAASAEIIRYLQADPLFVDIDEVSYNICPKSLEISLRNHADRVSAIIPVHIAGLPCKMQEILSLAGEYNIPVVEDSAHSLPVKAYGVCSDAQVFSFYATKPITTGEGGIIITNRDEIAGRIKVMRLHGIDRDVWDRYTSSSPSWFYQIVEAGYKYNLSDLAAALGRIQLKKVTGFLEARKKIAHEFLEGLSGLDYLSLPEDHAHHSWHLFMIKINKSHLTISRDQFIEKLKEMGVGVSVHYIPLHIMPYYEKRYGFKKNDFPISIKNFRRTISLPIYPGLTEEQTARIIQAVKEIGSRHYRSSR